MIKLLTLYKKYNYVGRWFIVGSITYATDYTVFIFLYFETNLVLFSNLISGSVSIFLNYLAHYLWSFKSEAKHTKTAFKYVINLLTYWTLGTLILKSLILSGVDPMIAKLLPIILIAPFSFLSLKFYVFKK